MKHGSPLRRYGQLYAKIFDGLETLSDEDLTLLRTASAGCTSSNCWWADYKVAQVLLPEIDGIIWRRKSAATKLQAHQ